MLRRRSKTIGINTYVRSAWHERRKKERLNECLPRAACHVMNITLAVQMRSTAPSTAASGAALRCARPRRRDGTRSLVERRAPRGASRSAGRALRCAGSCTDRLLPRLDRTAPLRRSRRSRCAPRRPLLLASETRPDSCASCF